MLHSIKLDLMLVATTSPSELIDSTLITGKGISSEALKSYAAYKKVLSMLAAPLRKAASKQRIQSTKKEKRAF